MALADLTDLASFKAYANVTVSNDDTLLSRLITQYSAWLRNEIGRDVTTSTYDLWRDGRGNQSLFLPQYPITAVALLEVDGVAVTPQASFTSAGYRFSPDRIILTGSCFTRGESNVHVQFTAGLVAVPADLAAAANELVALRYKERDRIGFASKSLAGETVAFITKAMQDSVATVVENYRPRVPA